MISSALSRISAAILLLGGIVLLFASDAALPALVPGFPSSGAWVGQLLAASWLGLAAMNWHSRSAVLGGIYGRGVVLANAATYFISALSLLRVAVAAGAARALWLLCVPALLLAVAYLTLLFRGPFDPLQSSPP